jgi:hypothetical protein
VESRIGPKHDDQGKEVRAKCRECGRENTHTIIASAEFVSEDRPSPDFSIQFWDEYQAIECKGCQTVSFRHCSRDTERTANDPYTGEESLVDSIEIYPKAETGRQPLHHSDMLPFQVQAIYKETLAALEHESRVLAGIGIRALVETMCRDREASGNSLEAQIDALVAQRVIAGNEAETLHSLRIMGNQAAHEVIPHPADDLHVAMDVIEHALQGIYILPAQAARLPRRSRGNAAGGPSVPPTT